MFFIFGEWLNLARFGKRDFCYIQVLFLEAKLFAPN